MNDTTKIPTLRDALKEARIWLVGAGGKTCRAVQNIDRALAATEGMEADPVGAVEELAESEIRFIGRVLANYSAQECGVDADDNWKIYSEEFVEDARAIITSLKKA